jgi:hypothetical protein
MPSARESVAIGLFIEKNIYEINKRNIVENTQKFD